jgi:rod shape-determining protein MreB
MAAAIGAELPVTHPVGSMVVDIGGGTTEVGVIATGGLSLSMSVRVGGDRMDEAISSYAAQSQSADRRGHGGAREAATGRRADRRKRAGSPRRDQGPRSGQGRPAEMTITREEIVEALAEPVGQIVEAVRAALEQTLPKSRRTSSTAAL